MNDTPFSSYRFSKEQRKEKRPDVDKKDVVFSDARYSLNLDNTDDIDQWKKDGMPEDDYFIMGSTGDIIQGLGAIESDIYMKGDKIKTILKEHPEMTLDEIKKIPYILDNPILVLASKNTGRKTKDNTRLVMFSSVKAKDGRPVMVVLDLRPVEKDLVIEDMQKVSSAYTKDSHTVEFIKDSKFLYADKKITTSLLSTMGFLAPIALKDSGYIGKISYAGPVVKLQGKSFNDVIDTNPTPKVSLSLDVDLMSILEEEYSKEENDSASIIEEGFVERYSIFALSFFALVA